MFTKRRAQVDRIVGWAVLDGYTTVLSIVRATGYSIGTVVSSLDRLTERGEIIRWTTDEGTNIFEPVYAGTVFHGNPDTIWLCRTHRKVALWPTGDKLCHWVRYVSEDL